MIADHIDQHLVSSILSIRNRSSNTSYLNTIHSVTDIPNYIISYISFPASEIKMIFRKSTQSIHLLIKDIDYNGTIHPIWLKIMDIKIKDIDMKNFVLLFRDLIHEHNRRVR